MKELKKGAHRFQLKLRKVTQDLIWGIYRSEKCDQVMELIFLLKILKVLK